MTQVPQEEKKPVAEQQPVEEQKGGKPAVELKPEEIEALFGGQQAAGQPAPAGQEAPRDEPEAGAEVTLRKQRTWGERTVEFFRRLLEL